MQKEEAQFNKTIDQGLSILADMEEEMKKNGETVLSGENAFKLYDTYGFPIDLTSEILEEKGLTYDKEGFEKSSERAACEIKREHLVLTATLEKTLQFMMNWMQSLQQNS